MWFDVFELDLKAGELRRDGAPVAIPPQQFIVLAALVEDPGALVTREQLRARLWGNDEFVDFDAGLNFCIRQLRLTLGDTASNPRFIQTVPRRGYRFVAPVLDVASAPRRVARWVTPALAAALLVIVSAGAWWSMTTTASSSATPLTADHRIADAHAAHGFVALNDDWAWDVAERSFGRALQLDPAHEVALISMSRMRAAQGRTAAAVTFARRAVDAHPDSLRALVTLGWSHLFAGDFRSALSVCTEAVTRQPASEPALQCRLNAESEMGTDQRPHWQRLLQATTGATGRRSFFQEAWLSARLGKQTEALALLRRAFEAHEPDAMFAAVHPAFVGLRTHPEFISALIHAGLRESSSSAH